MNAFTSSKPFAVTVPQTKSYAAFQLQIMKLCTMHDDANVNEAVSDRK